MNSEQILRLLPGAFQASAWEGSPLLGLLEAMEGLHAPSEAVLDRLDAYFDPRRAPREFVPYLAQWVDLDRIIRSARPGGRRGTVVLPTGRLRELIAEAAELSKWRGTAYGLRRFLELSTGVAGFEVDDHIADEGGRVRPFHIEVRVPADAADQRLLIERIVESEKPAYVTSALHYRGEAEDAPQGQESGAE